MDSHLMSTTPNEEGFTMVELMVVVLIIGILAAIAVPTFLNQRKAAVDASVQSDVRNLSTQLETWRSQNPHAPSIPSFSVNPEMIIPGDTSRDSSSHEFIDTISPGSSNDTIRGFIPSAEETWMSVGTVAGGEYAILAGNSNGAVSTWEVDAAGAIVKAGIYYNSARGGFVNAGYPAP